MKNTRIWYQYKDKEHHQKTASIVVAGRLSPEHTDEMRRSLHQNRLFIPAQVGMTPLSGGADHDHVWHEIDLSAAQGTMTRPTVDFNAQELAERFTSAVWNPAAETARMFGVDTGMINESRVSRQSQLRPLMRPI